MASLTPGACTASGIEPTDPSPAHAGEGGQQPGEGPLIRRFAAPSPRIGGEKALSRYFFAPAPRSIAAIRVNASSRCR